VLAARSLAGLEGTAPERGCDPVRAQIAADTYLGLPEAERAAICSTMSTRLGALWFGNRSETDDHAATHPTHAASLTALLIEDGHLTNAMTRPKQSRERPLEADLVNPHPTVRHREPARVANLPAGKQRHHGIPLDRPIPRPEKTDLGRRPNQG
jgi:hypothetical protein